MTLMQRREFIKKYIGVDYKTILMWSALLLAVYIFLRIDFSQIGNSIYSIIKTSLLIAGIFVVLMLSLMLVSFIVIRITDLLPISLTSWFKKNDVLLLNVISALVLLYLAYESFKREEYFLLIVMFLYFVFSYVSKRDKKAEKS
jgi:L-asparagine transporter-like permease